VMKGTGGERGRGGQKFLTGKCGTNWRYFSCPIRVTRLGKLSPVEQLFCFFIDYRGRHKKGIVI
jgi:hypothetical protein